MDGGGSSFAASAARSMRRASQQQAVEDALRRSNSHLIIADAAPAARPDARKAYSGVENAVRTSSGNISQAVTKLSDALKALLPPEEPALLRSNDGSVPRRPERVGGPPLAVRMALRDLHEAAEQFEKEDAPMAIDAAATLRDRVEAEVAERERIAREERSADVERTRRLLGESEERHKKALQEVDLLRNAVARRDTLLAEQRSAYYKDLLQYKQAERGGSPLAAPPPPPAASYDAAVDGPPLEERPSFFDACVFEALHLSTDVPLADKAKAALKQASTKVAEREVVGGAELAQARRELHAERRAKAEMEARYKGQVDAFDANVNSIVESRLRDAQAEASQRHKEEMELQWERSRQLEAEKLELTAACDARLAEQHAVHEASMVEAEAAFVTRLETRVAAAVSVVQGRLEASEAARASDKMAHKAEVAKMMAVRMKQAEEAEREAGALRTVLENKKADLARLGEEKAAVEARSRTRRRRRRGAERAADEARRADAAGAAAEAEARVRAAQERRRARRRGGGSGGGGGRGGGACKGGGGGGDRGAAEEAAAKQAGWRRARVLAAGRRSGARGGGGEAGRGGERGGGGGGGGGGKGARGGGGDVTRARGGGAAAGAHGRPQAFAAGARGERDGTEARGGARGGGDGRHAPCDGRGAPGGGGGDARGAGGGGGGRGVGGRGARARGDGRCGISP